MTEIKEKKGVKRYRKIFFEVLSVKNVFDPRKCENELKVVLIYNSLPFIYLFLTQWNPEFW